MTGSKLHFAIFLLAILGFMPIDTALSAPHSTRNHIAPCSEVEIASGPTHPCRAMVIFKSVTTMQMRNLAASRARAPVTQNFQSINTNAVVLPDAAAVAQLHNDPTVAAIIPDRISTIQVVNGPFLKQESSTSAVNKSSVPSGVKRIGAEPGRLPYQGEGVGVAIVDTGLDFNHPNLAPSADCFTAYQSCQDDVGHGTHVGGTVAALNNGQNVMGVAPKATLYAVKVLDENGRGYDSDVIRGLEWVATHANSVTPAIRVINMSLGREGTFNDNPAYHAIINRLTAMGITVVVSAGNNPSNSVRNTVPATYPEVITVASSTASTGSRSRCDSFSSMILQDTASWFSTRGHYSPSTGIGVSISAPGETSETMGSGCEIEDRGIISLKLGGGTRSMMGTSMAAPHVTGVAALLVEQAHGAIDPETIRHHLIIGASGVGLTPLAGLLVGSLPFDDTKEGVLSACGSLAVRCN